MSINNEIKKTNNKSGKHLIFTLHQEDYGISLVDVKEVISMTNKIRPVPHAPSYYIGLINLRGKIISVIDLRLKLSVPANKYEDKKTSIIITELDGIMIGSIVDDVKTVQSIANTSIDEWKSESKVSHNFIKGVSKDENGSMTLLLDMRKCLDIDEITKLHRDEELTSKANQIKIDQPTDIEISEKKAA